MTGWRRWNWLRYLNHCYSMDTTTDINPTGAVITSTAGAIGFYSEMLDAVYELRWMLLMTVLLVIVDFVTGLMDSVRKHGESFRFSRAGRRTFVKLIEYFAYLVLGVVIGKAICEPLNVCTHVTSAAIAACFSLLWEFDSIKDHVCSLHGIEFRFSVKKLFVTFLKKKNSDLGEAVEEALSDTDSDEKTK